MDKFLIKRKDAGEGGEVVALRKKQRENGTEPSPAQEDIVEQQPNQQIEQPPPGVPASALTTQTVAVAAQGVVIGSMPLTDPVWSQALSPEFGKPYFVKLLAFLAKQAAAGKAIYPPKDKVFHALNTCPLDRVRVVILGQDPYHGPGQAHGLSFSVAQGVAQPPSLRNIVKEATACCGTKPTKNGCLTPWAVQGVLLLNTVLTVEKGAPLSHHKKGWEQFTDEVVRLLNRQERTIVFLLWGKPSQQKGAHINRARHRVITCSHPSPLGATKTKEPFTGSRCFARANDMLVKSGQEPIDWNLE